MVVFTILSLVIILALYYGLDRYVILKMASKCRATEMINNYSSLRNASDDRTVVTFSSADDHNILPTVLSLLDQTVKVDQIALNSCLKKQPSDICLQVINVFRVSDKTEQFRGIVPTLEREKDSKTNIIWLRDDYIYGKDFIESMFDQKKDSNVVIAKDRHGKIIGILLKPDSLKTEIIDYEKSCNQQNDKKDCNSIESLIGYIKDDISYIVSTDSFRV